MLQIPQGVKSFEEVSREILWKTTYDGMRSCIYGEFLVKMLTYERVKMLRQLFRVRFISYETMYQGTIVGMKLQENQNNSQWYNSS